MKVCISFPGLVLLAFDLSVNSWGNLVTCHNIHETDKCPDLFARDAEKPSFVNVAAKAYRRIALYEPGEYTATLNYNNGSKTEATWNVRDLAEERKAKNIILFIGDGMVCDKP